MSYILVIRVKQEHYKENKHSHIEEGSDQEWIF